MIMDVCGIGLLLCDRLMTEIPDKCETKDICKENMKSRENMLQARLNGTLPSLPKEIEASVNPEIVAIRKGMYLSMQVDPRKRPTA